MKIEFKLSQIQSRMVCFSIELLVPKSERDYGNRAVLRRVEHLLRHCNTNYEKVKETESFWLYLVQICDEDAVTLLRDLPTPFNVLAINILHTKENLYTYRKHRSPPPILLYKKVYWLAKSTERWKLHQ
jgi:hypothetical protein